MKRKIKLTAVIIVLAILLSSCSSMQRWGKQFESEFKKLDRTLIVKSATGEVLHEYRGSIDIEISDQRVKYIDESGKLHIIYLGSSTAIVSER